MIEITRTGKALCPLQSIGQAEPVPCAEGLCAWWDGIAGFCSVLAGAEYIRDVAEQVCDLAIILERMEKNAPASAANTDRGKSGTDLTGPVSASNDTENQGGSQA